MPCRYYNNSVPQSPKPKVALAGTLNLKKRGKIVAPEFSSILEDYGFKVVDSGDVDILVNINHNWRSLAEHSEPKKMKVLIRLEPVAVYPSQYSDVIESKYDLIFTPGMPIKEDFIPWPYQYQENPLRPKPHSTNISDVLHTQSDNETSSYASWLHRKIFCSMIAANKVSPIGTGNYSLRREFARIIHDERLQIYGELWKASFWKKFRYRLAVLKFAVASSSNFSITHIFSDVFRTYPRAKGEVLNKHEVVKESKFSLVIENSDTYVSEKLLDALVSGSLPVYFGPDLTATSLSEDLVIRYVGPISEFMYFLDELSPDFLRAKLKNIEAYLLGRELLNWDSSQVFRQIARKISIRYNGGL